ncbi:hypothetical protein E2C01_029097 [Portunus trituberculatus]|uniref:Uncharacterized protein n=1 Tax=Portunus trituberculatus TaxID=210409 RepID=A0A5B7EQW8_PORTR|nr:hypothetical protein [Portunus trituberculatus]
MFEPFSGGCHTSVTSLSATLVAFRSLTGPGRYPTPVRDKYALLLHSLLVSASTGRPMIKETFPEGESRPETQRASMQVTWLR